MNHEVTVHINANKKIESNDTYVLQKINNEQWECLFYSKPDSAPKIIPIEQISELSDFIKKKTLNQIDIISIEEVMHIYHFRQRRSVSYRYMEFFYDTLRLINSQPNRQPSNKIDRESNKKYVFDKNTIQSLKKDRTYSELIKMEHIKNALNKFREKDFYKLKAFINHHEAYELFFVGIIAYCYADYLVKIKNKRRIKKTSPKDKDCTVNYCEKILEKMHEGVVMENDDETFKLMRLLGKLRKEIKENESSHKHKRQSKKIATKIFVENLFACFNAIFKDLFINIVKEIQSLSNQALQEKYLFRVAENYKPGSAWKLDTEEYESEALFFSNENNIRNIHDLYVNNNARKFLLIYIKDKTKWFFCGVNINKQKIIGYLSDIDSLISLYELINDKNLEYFKSNTNKKIVLTLVLTIFGYLIPEHIQHSVNHISLNILQSKRASQYERQCKLTKTPSNNPPENYF